MKAPYRIATSNLQVGVGTTRSYAQYLWTAWKYRLPHGSEPARQAAAFLREERVDVAVFCEVGGGAWRTRGVDQMKLITEESGLQERLFFPALVRGTRFNQGNGVCARFPLRTVANHRLPGTGEPRYLNEALLELEGHDVRLFVTHLSLKAVLRGAQVERIARIVGDSERPTILAGDFNVSREDELDLLAETSLDRAASLPTFPSWRPRRRLDHLFFSSHFHVLRTATFDAVRFSDHLPLVADVTFEPVNGDGPTTAR